MFNKPKLKKKQRVMVSPITYAKVLDRDKHCILCGSMRNMHLHHITYRSEDRSKINDIDNCCMLCVECHDLVHSNKKKYKPILMQITQKYTI